MHKIMRPQSEGEQLSCAYCSKDTNTLKTKNKKNYINFTGLNIVCIFMWMFMALIKIKRILVPAKYVANVAKTGASTDTNKHISKLTFNAVLAATCIEVNFVLIFKPSLNV